MRLILIVLTVVMTGVFAHANPLEEAIQIVLQSIQQQDHDTNTLLEHPDWFLPSHDRDGILARAHNPLNQPFVTLADNANRTPVGIALLHGLSDGPYFMRELSEIAEGYGANSGALVLPGHGISIEALTTRQIANFQRWYDVGKDSFKLAQQLGHKKIGIGYSTGGAILIDDAIERALQNSPDQWDELILFAPPIEVNYRQYSRRVAHLRSHINDWIPMVTYLLERPVAKETPYSYGDITANGFSILRQFINKVQAGLKRLKPGMKIPHLTIVTTNKETVVDNKTVIELLQGYWPGQVTFFSEVGVLHGNMTVSGRGPQAAPRALLEEIVRSAFDSSFESAPIACSSLFM